MDKNISRRHFIKTSTLGMTGAVAGALMLPGCREKDTPWYTIPRGAMNILGRMQYPSMISNYTTSSNSLHSGWVKGSRDRIKNVVENEESEIADNFAWDVELFASDEVNAWCMPGARMAFYEGIIPLCSNSSGVAIVMGHEVAHAVRNHSGQRLGMQLGLNLGLTAVDAVAKMTLGDVLDPAIIGVAMQVFAIGGQFGMLAYSRTHEHEADRMGLMYAAKAGFDPTEAPKFWKRMEDEFGDNSSMNFLSTHPAHKDRSQRLSDLQKEAIEYYEKSEPFEQVTIKERIKNLNEAMDEAWEHYKQAIS